MTPQPPARAGRADAGRAAVDARTEYVLTVAGACDLARDELRQVSNDVACGRPPRHLSALLLRYARCLDAAVRELRDPVCLPPRRRRPR